MYSDFSAINADNRVEDSRSSTLLGTTRVDSEITFDRRQYSLIFNDIYFDSLSCLYFGLEVLSEILRVIKKHLGSYSC